MLVALQVLAVLALAVLVLLLERADRHSTCTRELAAARTAADTAVVRFGARATGGRDWTWSWTCAELAP